MRATRSARLRLRPLATTARRVTGGGGRGRGGEGRRGGGGPGPRVGGGGGGRHPPGFERVTRSVQARAAWGDGGGGAAPRGRRPGGAERRFSPSLRGAA
jgi:hypothetical protein